MDKEEKLELDIGSLSALVYEELKRRLNSGLMRPGQFLDLSALGKELGMSRTPLRDAMIRLELEGFVTVYPRRGVMVRSLDLADIRDIYQIVGALESSVMERIALRFRVSDAERAVVGIQDYHLVAWGHHIAHPEFVEAEGVDQDFPLGFGDFLGLAALGY